MSHIMTITDGVPAFTCTEAPDAECYIYPACACDYYDVEHDAKHAKVQHEKCLLTGWYGINPETTEGMFLEGDDAMPDNAEGEIDIEWDDCPLWYFVPAPESHDLPTGEHR